ncbi:MAG: hypothetical protein IT577_20530 [Verrucomicrobiae bacterium]|nr:hypothetical protein [Verrucomicrobiae bacterium]
MHFRAQAAALLLTAGLAPAAEPPPIAVTVASADDVLLDPPGDGAARRASLSSAELALRQAMLASLSNLVSGAGPLTGTGPGPWRAHAEILECVSPDELRGAFGQGTPGIAVHASLCDISRGDSIPIARADFPEPAQRLSAAKSSRVLPAEEAARKISAWIIGEISAAIGKSTPPRQGNSP